jgi:hypothetical protein
MVAGAKEESSAPGREGELGLGMSSHFQILAFSLMALVLFKGCDKAPKYKRPTVPTPPGYKEVTPESFKETDNWKFAHPKDDVIRGKWWEIFNDPRLNALRWLMQTSVQHVPSLSNLVRSISRR